MNKRLLVIISIISLLIILIIVGLTFAVKKTRQSSTDEQTSKLQVKKLLDEEAVSAVASLNNDAIWFFNRKAELFRVALDGSNLTQHPLPPISGEVKQVSWPENDSGFIITVVLEGLEYKYYYDSEQKKYTVLPANIQNFDWLPDNKRIAYIWRSGDNIHQQLAVANADASGYKIITEKIFWPDFKVAVSSNGKEVLLVRSNLDGPINKIYKANLETGQIDIVVEEGKNLSALWVNAGNRFIFERAGADADTKLFLHDFASNRLTDLNIPTFLNKVFVDPEGKFLYAAVPKKDSIGEVFVKLDLASFKQEIYFDPSEDLQVYNLVFIANKLFFINTKDNKLYSIGE